MGTGGYFPGGKAEGLSTTHLQLASRSRKRGSTLHLSILLYCIVQRVLQFMFPSASSFIVLVFTVSLHASAYMAIFKCVGYSIFVCLKDSASLLYFFTWSHSACFYLWVSLCFLSLFLLFPCSFFVVCQFCRDLHTHSLIRLHSLVLN
jgi:hypothetical protein